MSDETTASPDGAPVFESRFRARSYELDAFDHVNHAVFLNWLEQARFEALEAGGVSMGGLAARGWSVVVARVEVDFEKEVRMGDELVVRTRVEQARHTSMTLAQTVLRRRGAGSHGHGSASPSGAAEEVCAARARVVAVWLKDGRPARIPDDVRAALGIP